MLTVYLYDYPYKMKEFLRHSLPIIGLCVSLVVFASCDTIFGTKSDSTNDEIIDEGNIDPNLENVDGYAPVLPFWEDFDEPTDVHVGFDQLVYVTDSQGLHLLDRADLGPRQTISMRGAIGVSQDRLLTLYVAARDSILVPERNNERFDLPVVYVIEDFHTGTPTIVDTLIFPFDDASLSTRAAQISRINRNRIDNYEQVSITSITTLADNTFYISRTGPLNSLTSIASADNIILEFERVGNTNEFANVRQLRSLSPVTPSLASSVGVTGLSSLVAPPQRNTFTDDRSFLLTQGDQNTEIPFRVLWVNAVETTDGLVFEPNRDLLRRDTTVADSFLYDPFKFRNPADIAFAGDQTRFIFVVDSELNRLYQFQANGEEGVIPPAGAVDRSRNLIVSFGTLGSGPKEFNQPSGVSYFDRIVYVADKGNNRIARFRLTSDFE